MAFDLELVDDFAKAPSAAMWNAALGAAATNVLFLTREYQQVWWDSFCSGCNSCSLNMLVLCDGDNPVGLAPFYLSKRSAEEVADEAARAVDWQRIKQRFAAAQEGGDTPAGRTALGETAPQSAEAPATAPKEGERVLQLVGGVAVTDYLDLIAPADRLEQAWADTLDYWATRQDDWDVIDLHSLPGWSPSRDIVLRLAGQKGWQVWSDIEETCPVAELPGDWEEYLGALSKKDRHELRRKMRRADEKAAELEYKEIRDDAGLQQEIKDFIVLHRKSDPAKARFMTPQMERFFVNLVAAMAGTGWPELAVLDASSKPVAAYFSFLYNKRIHLYNSGFDPEAGGYGAGFVLLVRRMQSAVEQGVKTFDFLRGDERYKYDLGARDNFIYRVIIRK